MARPKKTAPEKMDCVLAPLRCTAGERDAIKKRAQNSGLSLSEFQRQACLNTAVIIRESAADVQLIHELNRIGVNLNQIAKAYHLGKPMNNSLEASLQEIDQLITTLDYDS